jgi:hypothetical protein
VSTFYTYTGSEWLSISDSLIPEDGLEYFYNVREETFNVGDNLSPFSDQIGNADLVADDGNITYEDDGTRPYANLTGSQKYDAETALDVSNGGDFSAFFWLYPRDTDSSNVIDAITGRPNGGGDEVLEYFCFKDGGLDTWDGDNWIGPIFSIPENEWVFVGVSLDTSSNDLYMYRANYGDDTVTSQVADSSWTGSNSSIWRWFGQRHGDVRHFDGGYSVAAFYSRIPSSDEIDQVFESTK